MKEIDSIESWKKGLTIVDDKIGCSFRIKDFIGRGGMGEVWLVDNPEWEIEFAVKNPRYDLVQPNGESIYKRNIKFFLIGDSNDIIFKRFQSEFRDWIKLPIHPNIVTCFYAQELLGLPRIFLEYIEGMDLKEWIAKWIKTDKIKDWEKTILTIAIQIASGMACAHKHDLIHRDLTPKNVLIYLKTEQRPGIVINDSAEIVSAKITDFGLVKKVMQKEINLRNSQINKQNAADDGDNNTQGWGTPEYMPPEQAGEEYSSINKAADVYSYGVLLFEMVAGGRRPYELEDHENYKKNKNFNPTEEVKPYFFKEMHAKYEIPNVEKYRKDCPPKLSSLIRKCLQKEPDMRWYKEKEQNDNFDYFGTIKKQLIEIYNEEIKEEYKPTTYINRVSFHIAYYLKGLSLCVLGNFREAMDVFDATINLYKYYAPTYNAKGIAALHLGRYAEAIECFDKAIEIDSDFATAYNNKGNALLEDYRYAEAIEAYDKALDKLQSKTNTKNTIGVNVAGLEKYPNNVNIYKHKGDCYERLGNYAQATIWYNKATEITATTDITSPTGVLQKTIVPKELDALIEQGSTLVENRKFQDALEKFHSAIEINPNNADAHSKKSHALIGMGKFKAALEAVNTALHIEPNNADAMVTKGYILGATGKYNEAIELFNKATYVDHNNVDAWINKGNCYDRIGRKKEAEYCFNIANSL